MRRLIERIADSTLALLVAFLLAWSVAAWLDEPDAYTPPAKEARK